MTGGGQNDVACSSQSLTEETARTPTSLPPCNSLLATHIPFELAAEILCRLPVKTLLQLRRVCKSWNSLISQDSNFAKKHLRLSASSHDRHHLILIPTHSSPEFALFHSPISSIFSSTSTTTTVKQIRYSLREILNEGAKVNGVSSCDGILCFGMDHSSAILCNPSIRKFKILPPLKFPDQGYTLYTLVYDRFADNYKIIAVNSFSSKKEVNVHTLGTNYWRRIHHFPGPNLTPMPPGIFMNDSVNWLTLAVDGYPQFIVSLDLEKEFYQTLSLPVFDVTISFASFMTLGTLRGCLSLLFHRGEGDKFFDVWIMKEYGDEKSWTKLLSLSHMGEPDFGSYSKVLYILEDEQVLMECFKVGKFSVVVCDSKNNTLKIPNFQDNIHKRTTSEVYVESLISPL